MNEKNRNISQREEEKTNSDEKGLYKYSNSNKNQIIKKKKKKRNKKSNINESLKKYTFKNVWKNRYK